MRAYPGRRRRRSARATPRLSAAAAKWRGRFCTTTPRSRWRAFRGMASGRGRGCSASCHRTTCSSTGSAVREGQRQGQGGGAGRLDWAELPGADAAGGELRGAEREAARRLPWPAGRSAAHLAQVTKDQCRHPINRHATDTAPVRSGGLSTPQCHRAHVLQAEKLAPHRNPIRSPCAKPSLRPRPRRHHPRVELNESPTWWNIQRD